MMTIHELISDLQRRGVEWIVIEGELRYRPRTLPQEIKEQITRHKATLAAYALPGWPENATRPSWWLELAAEFPIGMFTQARPQLCVDPDCGFGVSVEWKDSTDGLLRWNCPRCGVPSAVDTTHANAVKFLPSVDAELHERGEHSEFCDRLDKLFT